jgi:2-(3-amino-3-carboxypropyl)histidine synthase
MRILLQFPEGLKQNALAEAEKLEKEGHEVFLSASSCYGACDLALDEAKAIGAQKLIHYGHSRFIRAKLPLEVEYREFHVRIDPSMLKSALPFLKGKKKIALVTTVQHIPQLNEMKSFLEKNGKEVLIGKGKFSEYAGQVLGCDPGAATDLASAILYVGDGKFHPTGIHAGGEIPILALNPYNGECRQLNDEIEKIKKRRKGMMLKALECKTFGILLSTKPGQFAFEAARTAKEEFIRRGLRAEILLSNELNPVSIGNFLHFECYVNTACPRIQEDREIFELPILNYADLKEFFSLFDEIKKIRGKK